MKPARDPGREGVGRTLSVRRSVLRSLLLWLLLAALPAALAQSKDVMDMRRHQ
jgi:hypothetical protein